MIIRRVNLSPNNEKWDEYTRKELLDSWRRNYANNTVNMSPVEGIPQGGLGYFDSQIYSNTLYDNDLKDLSPTDKDHPVNIAFEKRKEELNIEFNNSSAADRERLGNLMELEKDSHDYWQKSELFNKVLNDDENGKPYPKELVDEVRSEKKISEENLRSSMEDLINYDASYNHPLSYPNRNLNEYPVTDKERKEWCNRESVQGIKREYVDTNNVNIENKILETKEKESEAQSYSSYAGKSISFNDDRIPDDVRKYYKNYNPSFNHEKEGPNQYIGMSSNQKNNRVEGQDASSIEDKIKNYNKKEIENTTAGIENAPTLDKRDERIQSAQEKVKDIIPQETKFKEMPEMGEEKGFFSAWLDKTKEKVSDFKMKAVNLWENRVAPKLGIETEKSRKEAQQQVIDRMNRQEIRDFERAEKLKDNKEEIKPNENSNSKKEINNIDYAHKNEKDEKVIKNRPSGDSSLNNNQQEITKQDKQDIKTEYKNEDEVVRKRRPSSGINDEVEKNKNEIKYNDGENKHKPSGESSKQEFNQPKSDEDISRKMKI